MLDRCDYALPFYRHRNCKSRVFRHVRYVYAWRQGLEKTDMATNSEHLVSATAAEANQRLDASLTRRRSKGFQSPTVQRCACKKKMIAISVSSVLLSARVLNAVVASKEPAGCLTIFENGSSAGRFQTNLVETPKVWRSYPSADPRGSAWQSLLCDLSSRCFAAAWQQFNLPGLLKNCEKRPHCRGQNPDHSPPFKMDSRTCGESWLLGQWAACSP